MRDIRGVLTIGSAVALGLVVCLHLPSLPSCWLFHLGVPWFFFASGYWYSQSAKSYGEQVRVRVRSLLVPYYLLNLVRFPVLFVCNWIGWRYCGVDRVVDGSLPCVVRCLGLNPSAWPALVPTWFLRALFVVVVVVGGLARLCRGRRVVVCVLCWLAWWMVDAWGCGSSFWSGFFTFGLPVLGCACFATGMVVGGFLPVAKNAEQPQWISRIRRQLMPVYLLHVIVIVVIGWVAKATHTFDTLATVEGDIIMWFVGIIGAIALGEGRRRKTPKVAQGVFGGRG